MTVVISNLLPFKFPLMVAYINTTNSPSLFLGYSGFYSERNTLDVFYVKVAKCLFLAFIVAVSKVGQVNNKYPELLSFARSGHMSNGVFPILCKDNWKFSWPVIICVT